MATAGNITAVLTLDASRFKSGLKSANTALDTFKESMVSFDASSKSIGKGIDTLSRQLQDLKTKLDGLALDSSSFKNFNNIALGIKRVSEGLLALNKSSVNAGEGMNIITSIIDHFNGALGSVEVKVKGLANSMRQVGTSTQESANTSKNSINQMINELNQWALNITRTTPLVDEALKKQAYDFAVLKREFLDLAKNANAFNNITGQSYRMNLAIERNIANFGKLSAEFLNFAKNANAFNNISTNLNKVNSTVMKAVSNFNSFRVAFTESSNTANTFNASLNRINATLQTTAINQAKYRQSAVNTTTSLTQTSTSTTNLGNSLTSLNGKINTTAGATDKLSASNEKLQLTQNNVANATRQTGTAMNTMGASAQKGSASMNQMATTSTKLSQALYSLMRVGRLVAIMFGYQIAYQFLHATTETINARSEMENYSRMLNWSTSEQEAFNKSLDDTVNQFKRVNKYSLGETTMSIGVEFDLTPTQMAKANPIIAMITSEYMRAGRTPDEASLAVKDILQGEFQRLSRETGVGEEELIEAGWSGDPKDVEGLLDALKKIGTARHWDDFAEKASSLNDIITILQNRFGEWSAEMVNMVQPAIVNAFNSIMSFAGGLSESLGNLWQWLSGGSWSAVATQIGLVVGAIVTAVHSLTAWRTGATMVQVANMGLKNSIMGLVFGIKAEELANYGVAKSITAKILGLNAEKVAEIGLTGATNQAIFTKGLEKTTTEAQIAVSSLREGALVGEATAVSLVKDSETGAIIVKQGLSLATTENTTTTIGFTGALGMMIAGEQLAEGETLSLAGSLGALTGAFLTSPIGWFTIAVLALASAFYVLTGGMSDCWDQMQRGNEILENAGDYQKKNEKYLANLKEQVGETSQTYKDAEKSVNNFKKSLQSTSLWVEKSKKAYEGLDATMSTKSKSILKDYGFSDEDIEKYDAELTGLGEVKRKYYHAEQVYNKQIADEDSNFATGMKRNLDTLKSYNGDMGKFVDEYTRNYRNLAEHSYQANTAEDWWTWFWNSLYVGLDKFWINWQEFSVQLGKKLDEKGLIGAIVDALKYAFGTSEGRSGILDIFISETGVLGIAFDLEGKIKSFKMDWGSLLTGALQLSPLGQLGGGILKLLTDDDIAKFLFGKDATAHGIQENIKSFLWNTVGGSLTSGLGGVFDLDIYKYGQQLYDAILGLPQWITDGINYIGGNISEAWNNLWKDFKLFDEDKFNELLGDPEYAKQKLQEWWNSILEWFGGIGQSITDWFSNTGNNISDISHGIVQWIIDGFAGFSEFALQIPTLIDTYIIQPISTAIMNGLMSIPFVSDILQMLGLIDGAEPTATEKGTTLANAIKTGIEMVIGNIPILGDILKILGIIPQANPTASANGSGVGNAIKTGLQNAINNLGKIVSDEFWNAVNNISNFFGEAWNKAYQFGKNIVDGVKSALHINSPGIVHDLLGLEFGTYTPQAIDDSGATAFASAQQYGQQVINGVSSMYANMPQVTMDFFTNGALSEYQTDANTVTTLSSDLSLTTVDAFNSMQSGVNTSVTGMASDVTTQYMAMQQNQNTMMTSMQNANLTGYRQMNLQTNQQLLSMRNETQQVTTQMIGAWSHMKTQLVATANALRSESTAHFNALSSTIGSFYRKIQNPANWGGASSSGTSRVRTKRNPTVGRKIASSFKGSKKYAGGSDLYNGRSTMTVQALKRMICPNGNCDLFDGYNMGDTVNVMDFLMSVEDGAFGWNNWKPTHYNYIKNKSDQWNMKSPQLLGRINTNANFKVGDFENGTPKISFGSFQSMAESLFSAIPYRFYYNSDWKGSWLGAIQAGACNCWDGAHALLAFANTCGFSGSIAHGSWNGVPHVWAVIEGRKMDTTGWQQRGTWTPSASAGGLSSSRYAGGDTKTYNISINIDTIYGEDDFEKKMRESAQKVMREEFNDPYTIPI